MRKGRGLAPAQRLRVDRVDRRHHQKMTAIRRTGAVQPCVAESKDLVVSIVIARGVKRPFVKEPGDRFGTQTHHPEGRHRAGEVVPADPGNAAGTHKRVDPPPQFPGLNLSPQLARGGPNNSVVFEEQRSAKRNAQEHHRQGQEECDLQPPPPFRGLRRELLRTTTHSLLLFVIDHKGFPTSSRRRTQAHIRGRALRSGYHSAEWPRRQVKLG